MCRGICRQFKFERVRAYYSEGAKLCKNCDGDSQFGVFIKYDGLRCPCCNGKLTSKPRQSDLKKKYYKSMGEQNKIPRAVVELVMAERL